MYKLSTSQITRAFALISIILVAYAQYQAPVGDADSPLHLMSIFIYFPAGWSLSIFLVIALSMPDRAKLVGFLGAAVLVGAAIGRFADSSEALRDALIGFGVAPYLFALSAIARNRGEARQDWIDMLALGSLIHITALAIPYFRDRTALDLPNIVDYQVATLDGAFGLQISSAVSIALNYLPSLRLAAFSAYALVQIPLVVITAINWKRRETRALCVLPTFMVASMIGFVCYHLAPVIGPNFYFGASNPVLHATASYLSHLPSVDFVPNHPRNCMPSLHFTWALLVFLFSRRLPFAARAMAATFTGLTIAATLGLREHYFMDLIVALPLALLTRSLCAFELGWTAPERRNGIALGLGMLAMWIGLIPLAAYIYPPVVVAISVLTSAIALTFERSLAGAEQCSRSGGMSAAAPGNAVPAAV